MAVNIGRATRDGTDGHGNRGRDGVGREIDDRDGAVAERKGCGGSGAGQVGVAAVDDVGAAVDGVLQDADHDGVDADGNGCENRAEADRVDWIVGIAVGIGGESGRRAERNADDADRACVDAVACVGDDHFVAGGREVSPERRRCRRDGVGGSRGHDVEQVGLGVDDADRAVGLVHDEGALGVGGHDAVDRTAADGDGIGIDGVAGGLDGGDLTGAAADALADGVDARGAGDADDVDRSEGRIDGELLLQVEGLTRQTGRWRSGRGR